MQVHPTQIVSFRFILSQQIFGKYSLVDLQFFVFIDDIVATCVTRVSTQIESVEISTVPQNADP